MTAAAVLFGASLGLAAIQAGAQDAPVSKPVPPDLVISLERTACLGTCPVYKVTIDATGNVTYEGSAHVHVRGRRTDTIPVARVAALLETVRRIGFFDLRDSYRSITNPDGSQTIVMDLPTTIVSIATDGRTKRVEDYFGAPPALKELERQIDEAAGTERWIRGDKDPAHSRVRPASPRDRMAGVQPRG